MVNASTSSKPTPVAAILSPRRVSWVPPTTSSPLDTSPSKRRRATLKFLPRQRSFSLESKLEPAPKPWKTERRCISLKNSPQVPRSKPTVASGAKSERSIFAELRRSSEVFKTILLNFSPRETSPPTSPPLSSSQHPPGIDVPQLLAAHEQRRLATFETDVSFSSSSSSTLSSHSSFSSLDSVEPVPVDTVGESGDWTQGKVPHKEEECLIKVNPELASDKVKHLASVYTRQYLFTLPALFLAVVRGNASIVYLLLKYGACVNSQDNYGNTPLHLACVHSNLQWDCILDLLERGARIALKNQEGFCPNDLVPERSLGKFQLQMLDYCWKGLTEGYNYTSSVINNHQSQQNQLTQSSTKGPKSGSVIGNKTFKLPVGRTRTESIEDDSNTSVVEPGISSTGGSVRSRTSTHSPDLGNTNKDQTELAKKLNELKMSSRGRRKTWQESHLRSRQLSNTSASAGSKTTKLPCIELERSFQVLFQMSNNPECLGYVLKGLYKHIHALLRLLQYRSEVSVNKKIAALMHNSLKIAIESYTSQRASDPTEESKKKAELNACLILLLKICLNLMHGVHDLQYTGLATINKVIDTSIVYDLAHLKVNLYEVLYNKDGTDNSQNSKDVNSSATARLNRGPKLGTKRLGSVWKYTSVEQTDPVKTPPSDDNQIENTEQSILDVLSSVHALSVLNILHNSITLYKRVIGSRQQCTPSNRWRHCSYHCLQILAARVLLFMVENMSVQDQLSQEPQLKILCAALDSTHDPQLLVLVLQIVATLSLSPHHHRNLVDHGLPDVLSQLLLPSDEWYYTNHSTKYAKYVKHHAARTLVYLGFQHRVNLKFSIYDILQEDAPPATPLMESAEDDYITQTSASPSVVVAPDTKYMLGVGIEHAVVAVLKTIETTLVQGTVMPQPEISTLNWVQSGNSYTTPLSSKGPGIVLTKKLPSEPTSALFAQSFTSSFPVVLDPVVLLRLLVHRLLTTTTHLQRWKSCASRSSFASMTHGEVPRSPRSRASSTDTDASTLRKRRKVNLTLDCSGWSSDPNTGGADTLDLVQRHSFSRAIAFHRPSTSIHTRGDSISSASGLGLEPAMQAMQFAFSHILKPAHSRDSIGSNSSDERRSSSGSPPGGVLPLSTLLQHKARTSFRFSSLRRSNKQRSKSHANINKVHHQNGYRGTPEQEILAFQKQLQNLPDFDSPENPGPITDPALAAAEFLARGTLGFQSAGCSDLTNSPNLNQALPIAGGSPVSTPVEERRPLPQPTAQGQTSCAPSSRRSSLTPSDRTNRRRDSPACIQFEVPPWHRAIFTFIEEWLRISKIELHRNANVCRELRDFFNKITPCGQPYQQWCAELRGEYPVLNKDPDLDSGEDLEETDREYCQLLQRVVSGDLPCSKEEAATLAGIQLRIEESWGRPILRDVPNSPISPDGPSSTLKPISEDKESFLLEVPTFGPGGNIRPVSPLMEDAEGEEGETDSKKLPSGVTTPGYLKTLTVPAVVPLSTSVTVKQSILSRCYPFSSSTVPFLPSGRIEDCLPPCYREQAKYMSKLIKDQKRKLFHSSIYESEIQLKKLYVHNCKRLPAYGCKIYQVKELLRKTKTKQKASRLLCVGPDKIVLLDNKFRTLSKSQSTSDLVLWSTGGGRSHDRLQLEFRATKWSLVVPCVDTMRDLGLSLWEILQELDATFLEDYTLLRVGNQDGVKRSAVLQVADHSDELECLQRMLHFPEEVAAALTEVEYRLFYNVPPIDYLRQVTLDVGTPSNAAPKSSVRTLVKRFKEVSSWVTHLIITQPAYEDRKCVLSCILRVALSCWNMGNFNSAMEIIGGLKSTKLKPFWLSVYDKECLPVYDFLSVALLSVEYERALRRALEMPECRVVPFFGEFIRDLKSILAVTPSLVVLSPTSGISKQLEFISDYNGEDHYFTRIGPGGLLNLDKIYKTHAVMDRIASFHLHYHQREHETNPVRETMSIHTSSIERSYLVDEEEGIADPEFYDPVQSLAHDHNVSFISTNNINHHQLQILHHGVTMAHWEAESNRTALVYIRLERSCGTLTWGKTAWSALKVGSASSSSTVDYNLGVNPEDMIPTALRHKMLGEVSFAGLEEGFVELSYVKEVSVGGRDRDRDPDLVNALRRYQLDKHATSECVIAIVYGNHLSDNRTLYLLCPPILCRIWNEGLVSVVRALKRELQMTDRRMYWLKEQFLQLYFDNDCAGPLIVDAIRIFGGRDWAATTSGVAGTSPPDNGTLRRGTSTKFRKKRSIGNLQMLRDGLEPGGTKRTAVSNIVTSSPQPGPSRSRSISSDLSPLTSSDVIDKISPVTHRETLKTDVIRQMRNLHHGSITHETTLDFTDFVLIFRSFSLRMRKDIKDLFEQFAQSIRSLSDNSLNEGSNSRASPEPPHVHQKIPFLTRNSSIELSDAKSDPAHEKKVIYDAISAASIMANCAGVDTSKSKVITMQSFTKFLETKQMEALSEEEVKNIIQRHEPDSSLRAQHSLSFEGFARYLTDKDNYAFAGERMSPDDLDMEMPLSHYFIASSHNTYLTGHQLKGESSVDLYSQVLLSGCRCVELDCWDGDDGNPQIYHGHTFTTKISFRSVVEAINKSAFITSPYPVILSIENHCSLQQQARMALIFQNIFGEKLVTRFMFEADFGDEPHLPSPSQMKYRILVKNKKLTSEIPHPALSRGNRSASRIQNHAGVAGGAGRTSSIVSNTSGGSVNDEFSDEEDDEDDDENIDVAIRTDSLSSHESGIKAKPKHTNELDWAALEEEAHKAKKQSTQIAKELSDLIIYVQAIKFRGLSAISPSSSVKYTKRIAGGVAGAAATLKKASGGVAGTSSSSSAEVTSHHNKRANTYHPCYQCSSLNENTAKKLCRKQPLALLSHTETQLVRTYPAGMRIDSSNFNPVTFWAYGIQMVALNYQTDDSCLHLNSAMFERNGKCGYVPKPSIMYDRTHMMYRRFNPTDKQFDGLHSTHFILSVISGQYLSLNNFNTSIQIEAEIIGIPVDCCKQKTKVIPRNALNPIYNDTFFFQIMFSEMAFLRFSVIDVTSNHQIIAQRVIHLECLKPGYRHVRLRNLQNQPLHLSTLFIYSRTEEESLDYSKEGKDNNECEEKSTKTTSKIPGVKRKMFFLVVYGVLPDEQYTILKITQESTTQEVILQALQKAGTSADKVNEYFLVEEVSRGWDKKDKDLPATQRVLDQLECPLQAQAQWTGEGRFLLKRMGDDPSSRAWLSSIMSTRLKPTQPRAWDEADNFLVCVYNVSPEIPYAILKVPLSASAQDVLAQALVKARRMEDPSRFVLIEELEWGATRQHRILPDEENVYRTQAHWQTLGKFILHEKKTLPGLEKLKGFGKVPIGEILADSSTSRLKSRFPLGGLGRGGSAREPPLPPQQRYYREVHSEGETLSDEDGDFMTAVSRLRRVAERKLRLLRS
uniref:Phosphoinositide phospholipase C n=2 Tax=Cacopsylla melanoneura TaxID=428564 RepID=A0A8D9BY52_9HEMI